MADYLNAQWEASWDAPSKRDRRGGSYRPYIPDPLVGRPVVLPASVAQRTAQIERSFLGIERDNSLEHLARFLLRSEAIASSRIEGLQASPQQVALAELSEQEAGVKTGFTATAKLVANNVSSLRRAVTDLVEVEVIGTSDVECLHRALLPDERLHGLRSVQNWVGGGLWHPLDAAYVPPPPAVVTPLMEDLVVFLSGAAHSPLVQAALVHAQFETVHPFVDGNGRVGRALIHTVLTRRGLTPAAVLPISMVLLTQSGAYIDGLNAFRYSGPPDGPGANESFLRWFDIFCTAAEIAVVQAEKFVADLTELHAEWHERHVEYRLSAGLTGEPRRTSAVARLLLILSEAPVLTAQTVQRLLGVSQPAARAALEELASAGILHRKQVDRGATGYLAREVFDLLTLTERRLASTRWDTRQSNPIRPAPARPQR